MHAAFDLPGASLRVDGAANIVRRHNAVEAAILVQNYYLGSITKGHMRGRILQRFRRPGPGGEVTYVFPPVLAPD